jgi:hypothetical protein
MKPRRYRPWFAVLVCSLGGGLCGLFILIDQSRKNARFPLSPLTAVLGGAALGVIAVQVLWLRDLVKRGEREPGSMVVDLVAPERPDSWLREVLESAGSRPRRFAAVMLGFGLVFLCFNHAFVVLFRRIHVAAIVGGAFMAVLGLAGLGDPRLLADPRRISSNKPGAGADLRTYGLMLAQIVLSVVALGSGLYLWKFVY